MVDGNDMDAAVEGARVARANGTKVLYDCGGLYAGVERLLALTDIMIPSEEFAMGHTGCNDAISAAKKHWKNAWNISNSPPAVMPNVSSPGSAGTSGSAGSASTKKKTLRKS